MSDLERVVFALLREGSTEDALIPHLESLVVRAGAQEALGLARPYGGSVGEKLSALLGEDQSYDLVFIHRDADSAGSDARRREIAAALTACGAGFAGVPVVPVQETESWLLTDEAQIRSAVGKPSGRAPLGLPALRNIERTSMAKEVLKGACISASGATGRRREKEAKQFGIRRQTLISRLDIDGPVASLASWQALVSDVTAAVRAIGAPTSD